MVPGFITQATHSPFYDEGMEDLQNELNTPLLEAVRQTVDAEECGLLWQVLQALDFKHDAVVR
jgi:hypothetical protein